jgi:hypothetical protein
MVRRACAILVVGLVCWGWSASGAAAQESGVCQVGTTPAGYPYEGMPEPTSEILYIGCGSARGRPLNIIAYDSAFGLCIEIAQGRGSGGSCPHGPIEDGSAIRLTAGGNLFTGAGSFLPSPNFTVARGILRSDVASVSVRFRSKGRARHVPAAVAQIDGELAKRLNQSAPFGFFAAVERGCFNGRHINAKALTAAGEILGRDRGGGGCEEVVIEATKPSNTPP